MISQFISLINKLSIDELGIRHRLEQEVERYHRFNTKVLKTSLESSKTLKDVDIKNYAKYLLSEGTVMEKRQLLACMKSRLALKNKSLMLTER